MSKSIELQELDKWKVGQEVIVSRGSYNERLAKITRITSGRDGTVFVSDIAFDLLGHERGNRDNVWSRAYMYPATSEDIEKIAVKNRRAKVCSYHWDNLSDDQITYIFKLIQTFEKDKKENG